MTVPDRKQAPIPMPMLGHVTSAYHRATLGRSIALGVVAGGRARTGETLFVLMPGTAHRVTLCDPLFYDRDGARLDG